MKKYKVYYLDDREWESREMIVDAEDKGDALEKAMDKDYYFGKVTDIIEL